MTNFHANSLTEGELVKENNFEFQNPSSCEWRKLMLSIKKCKGM